MQVLSHLTWALPSSPRELLPGVFVLWVKLLSTASVITQGCVLGNWDSKKTFLCRWSFSLMRHTVLWVCFPLLLLRPMSAVFKCSWQQTNHELKMCGNVVCHEDQSVEESIYIWMLWQQLFVLDRTFLTNSTEILAACMKSSGQWQVSCYLWA